MTLLIEISNIEPLKNFFDIIYDSVSIVEMKLMPDKLSISLLNNSHVAFYNLEMSKEFFDNYGVDTPESVLVFVEDFYKILKSAIKNEVLLLESNDNYLVCKFENGSNRRIFELPLAEESYESVMPPSIDYDDEFIIELGSLKQSVSDLDKIVKTDKFKMIAQGNILNIVAPTDSMTQYNQIVSIESDCYCNVTVNLLYIQQILKLSKINKNVTLKLGDDLPLTWNIHSTDESVKIGGLIAPILEQDEG